MTTSAKPSIPAELTPGPTYLIRFLPIMDTASWPISHPLALTKDNQTGEDVMKEVKARFMGSKVSRFGKRVLQLKQPVISIVQIEPHAGADAGAYHRHTVAIADVHRDEFLTRALGKPALLRDVDAEDVVNDGWALVVGWEANQQARAFTKVLLRVGVLVVSILNATGVL